MNAFYADPAVRQRLIDFMGGDTLEGATAVYLTHSDGCQFQRSGLHPPGDLPCFLDEELDIARSLADHSSLLLHLDVEYVNFDAPGEAFVDPWRTFDLQEPVVRAVEALLLGYGIVPLHLITGQGHHFVWRVRLDSETANRLVALSPAPDLIEACMARRGPGIGAAITHRQQSAFAGISLLMEFLAQRIKWEAAPLSTLPVEITAVHVGPCVSRQREMISIDISEYGDPLVTRMIRMPFTHYVKPWISGLARNLGIEEEIPRFHTSYYAVAPDPEEVWAETYGCTPLDPLPPCVQDILVWPNDRLLKPAGIQLVTRTLLAEGWHPRHIAGLIRSKFSNPIHGWGIDWQDYEPGTRADFYTRLFVGQLATGVDQLVDFNCRSMQEKGFCTGCPSMSCPLDRYRHSLITSRFL